MARLKTLTKKEDDFLGFLEGTLIPDLRESGQHAMADDFSSAINYIMGRYEDPREPRNFVKFLRETLIPDLKESGYIETAKDFATAARMIERRFQKSTMAGATTSSKQPTGSIKLTISEIAKKLGLPDYDDLYENNIDYISEAGNAAEQETRRRHEAIEAEREVFIELSPKTMERAREKAEQAASDELFRRWQSAIERAAEEIWGFHHLYVNETAKGHYQVLPATGKTWHDVARQIAITINGVGLTDVPAEEYARAPKAWVATHIKSMQVQPEVYGTASASRIYEQSFR